MIGARAILGTDCRAMMYGVSAASARLDWVRSTPSENAKEDPRIQPKTISVRVARVCTQNDGVLTSWMKALNTADGCGRI